MSARAVIRKSISPNALLLEEGATLHPVRKVQWLSFLAHGLAANGLPLLHPIKLEGTEGQNEVDIVTIIVYIIVKILGGLE
jgi:hypothetical protein